jgi:hypothetical protein
VAPKPPEPLEIIEITTFCRLMSRKEAADWRCHGVEVTKVCHCGVQVTAFPTIPDYQHSDKQSLASLV